VGRSEEMFISLCSYSPLCRAVSHQPQRKLRRRPVWERPRGARILDLMRPLSKTLLYSSLFKHTRTHRIWDSTLIPKSLLCHMAEIICVLSQAAVVATATCSSARRRTLWGRGLSLSLSACVWEPTLGGKKRRTV